MKIDTDFFSNDKGYSARGIVARIERIGFYENGPILKLPIYRYLTLDCGKGQPSIAVKFVRQAEIQVTPEGSFLDPSKVKEGEIVVSPGFIYKKIPMSSALMAEHLKALKTYRPKDIVTGEVDKAAGQVDLGAINLPPNNTVQ